MILGTYAGFLDGRYLGLYRAFFRWGARRRVARDVGRRARDPGVTVYRVSPEVRAALGEWALAGADSLRCPIPAERGKRRYPVPRHFERDLWGGAYNPQDDAASARGSNATDPPTG